MKAIIVLVLLFISMLVITEQITAQDSQTNEKLYLYGTFYLQDGSLLYTQVFTVYNISPRQRFHVNQDMLKKFKEYIKNILKLVPYRGISSNLYENIDYAERDRKDDIERSKLNNKKFIVTDFKYSWKG